MKKLSILLAILFTASASFAQDNEGTDYPVTISFHSIGTGIPSDQPLRAFVKKFKKENNMTEIEVIHIGPLGREGEYKLAFPLNNFTPIQKRHFTSGVGRAAGKMTERGSVEVLVNDKIVDGAYNGRTTITTEKW